MTRFFLILALLLLSSFSFGAGSTGSAVSPVAKITCTGTRDEPDSPTYQFELVRGPKEKYEARFLNLPGDQSAPPVLFHSIPDLTCRFYSGNRFLFQCEKFKASVESTYVYEDSLSLIANKIHRDRFREIRAIGVDVPNNYLIFRFLHADRCLIQKGSR